MQFFQQQEQTPDILQISHLFLQPRVTWAYLCHHYGFERIWGGEALQHRRSWVQAIQDSNWIHRDYFYFASSIFIYPRTGFDLPPRDMLPEASPICLRATDDVHILQFPNFWISFGARVQIQLSVLRRVLLNWQGHHAILRHDHSASAKCWWRVSKEPSEVHVPVVLLPLRLK